MLTHPSGMLFIAAKSKLSKLKAFCSTIYNFNPVKRSIILLLILACSSSSFGQWEVIGGAGCSEGIAYNITMEVDESGTPYVAYADGAFGQKPTVMKFNGYQWVTVGNAGI